MAVSCLGGQASAQTLTFILDNGHIYRMAAKPGAEPEDITQALDELYPETRDEDAWLNIAPDGETLLLETERFHAGCADWACLAVMARDLSRAEAVLVGGEPVHVQGFSAVASGGELIVYPGQDGPHDLDLWAISRQGKEWSEPVLVTGDSNYAFNSQPALNEAGTHVVFDCGNEPYGQGDNAICEASVDGASLRVVMTPQNGPLHHPDYGPDGWIYFENDNNGEYIVRLDPETSVLDAVDVTRRNDNSPCVLPDGTVASLWLDRPQGEGLHEIKLYTPLANETYVLVRDRDVLDIGLGCGR